MFKKYYKYLQPVTKTILLYLKLLFKKKSAKRIIVFSQFSKNGGERTYFKYLLEHLSLIGYTVIVVLHKEQLCKEIDELFEKYDVVKHISSFYPKTHRFNRPFLNKSNLNPLYDALTEFRYLSLCGMKYNSSNYFISVSNPDDYLSAFLLPIRLIYMTHTVPWFKQGVLKNKILVNRLSKKKSLLSVSRFSQEFLSSNWAFNKKNKFIKYIYNFYEPISKVTNCVKRDTIRILTIGSVIDYKNPFFWIDVAQELIQSNHANKIEFIWAGDGPLLQQAIDLTRFDDRIKFTGYIKDVENLYSNADIYFQPSLKESHGIAVLGAMYHSLPTVVSNIEGLPESVDHNLSGYIFNVEKKEEAILYLDQLINSVYLRNKFGIYAKELFNQKFTKNIWQNQMNNILNIVYK